MPFVSSSSLISRSGTLAVSSHVNSFSSCIFLKINVDLIDQFLWSSSSIKTPFICASIFGIGNFPYVYFFTTVSASSHNCIFFLESLIFMSQLIGDDLIVLCQFECFLWTFIDNIIFSMSSLWLFVLYISKLLTLLLVEVITLILSVALNDRFWEGFLVFNGSSHTFSEGVTFLVNV